MVSADTDYQFSYAKRALLLLPRQNLFFLSLYGISFRNGKPFNLSEIRAYSGICFLLFRRAHHFDCRHYRLPPAYHSRSSYGLFLSSFYAFRVLADLCFTGKHPIFLYLFCRALSLPCLFSSYKKTGSLRLRRCEIRPFPRAVPAAARNSPLFHDCFRFRPLLQHIPSF